MTAEKMHDGKYQINSIIIPFTDKLEYKITLPQEIEAAVTNIIDFGLFAGRLNDVYSTTLPISGKFVNVILAGLGDDNNVNNRKIFISFAKALKKCKELKSRELTLYLDNAPSVTHKKDICAKICELPYLVYYSFNKYKSLKENTTLQKVEIECSLAGFEKILEEAFITSESTILARNLTNERSAYMTPSQFAEEALKIGDEAGIEVNVLDKPEIEKLKMGAFLAVSKGAAEPPKLIIIKYYGGEKNQETIGLVGKGIMYDSGGYSIKAADKMMNMFNDMAGAAAVVGAVRAIAKMKLKVNVIGIIAACENKISAEAYVPGDILTSMSGKTIEVLNTDAEGRLTLADAITYAIRYEKVDKLIDIATLTGAATYAVGNKTSAVISNDDDFFNVIKEASLISCEKIWRLDADEELGSVIYSDFADIKNSSPGNKSGGGAIVAGLFIKEFVENTPWIHIDMAPVNFIKDDVPYSEKGASGYGVSLIYNALKLMCIN